MKMFKIMKAIDELSKALDINSMITIYFANKIYYEIFIIFTTKQ